MNPLDSHKSSKSGNPDGGKRVLSWADHVKALRPVKDGPVVSQTQTQAKALAQAQDPLAFPLKNITHSVAVPTFDPIGVNEFMVCVQGKNGSGESSTNPGVVAAMMGFEAPMRALLPSSLVLEVRTPFSTTSQSARGSGGGTDGGL